MEIQRDEAFEEAYSNICKPIIARPYPRNENGEYFYKEIHEAHLMWQAAKASAPEWISVDDRLPKFEQEVLLFSGGERLVGQYLPAAVNEFGIHFDEGFWVNSGASIELDATHWMSLPEAPIQEKK